MASTGGVKTIWPVFGAANQLVGALALVVVSSYLIGVKRPRLYTVLPAIFMLLTTIGALIFEMTGFFAMGTARGYLLGGVSVILTALALYIAFEAKDIFLFIKGKREPIVDPHPAWSRE